MAPKLRVAFEVTDAAGTTRRLVEAGDPGRRADRDPVALLNARLDAPAGLHVTVFQELDVG
ncbi:MAG: hypothetical protein U0869_19920 [Chloroflexota bacterium]